MCRNNRQDAIQLTVEIPASLHSLASAHADSCGVSLDGLIRISILDYLAARGYKITQSSTSSISGQIESTNE